MRQEIEQAVEAAAKAKDINYSLKWRGFQAEGCVMDPKVKYHSQVVVWLIALTRHFSCWNAHYYTHLTYTTATITHTQGDMMQLLGQVHKRVTGKEPIYTPVTCTTDARFFELYQSTPCTCYGPESTNIHGYLHQYICAYIFCSSASPSHTPPPPFFSFLSLTSFLGWTMRVCSIDESVSLQSVKEVTQTLAIFLAEWCGLEPAGSA